MQYPRVQPLPPKPKYSKTTVKTLRLPDHKVVSLKFPVVSDPARQTYYGERKVNLISGKVFRAGSSFKKEDLFTGSLKLM